MDTQQISSEQKEQTRTPDSSKLGCIIMAAPVIVFVLVLLVWGAVAMLAGNAGGVSATRSVNVVLGFVGILSMIASPICFIVGLVILLQKK